MLHASFVQPLLLRGCGASAFTPSTRRAFAAPPPTYHRRRLRRRLSHAVPSRASAAHGHAGAVRFALRRQPSTPSRDPSPFPPRGFISRPRAGRPPAHPDSRGPGGFDLRCAPRPTHRGAASRVVPLLSNSIIRLLWRRCLGGDSARRRGVTDVSSSRWAASLQSLPRRRATFSIATS